MNRWSRTDGVTHSSAQAGSIRRVFVDVSTIHRHDAKTGIQRVVRSICQELGREKWSNVEVFAVAASARRPYHVVRSPLLPNGPTIDDRAPLRLSEGDFFLGLDLSVRELSRYELQLAGWRKAGAGIGVVVYDLLPFQRPEWFPWQTGRRFGSWLGVLGRRADVLFPISKTVGEDLSAYLDQHHPRRLQDPALRVLPLSGDIGAFEPDENVPIDFIDEAMAKRPAILLVGTVEPRKGHAAALAAHQHLWRENPRTAPLLIFAGRPGWRTNNLQEHLRALDLDKDGAFWMSDVCDTRLDRLYRSCAGVIVASYGEGYCLPLHEALSYGKPTLARDLPVLREFADNSITYFPDDDPVTLGLAIKAVGDRPKPASPSIAGRGWDESVAVIRDSIEAWGLRSPLSEVGQSTFQRLLGLLRKYRRRTVSAQPQ